MSEHERSWILDALAAATSPEAAYYVRRMDWDTLMDIPGSKHTHELWQTLFNVSVALFTEEVVDRSSSHSTVPWTYRVDVDPGDAGSIDALPAARTLHMVGVLLHLVEAISVSAHDEHASDDTLARRASTAVHEVLSP